MVSALSESILEDLRSEDGLVVMAHGLGAAPTLARFASSFLADAPPGSIVLGLHISAALCAELWRDNVAAGRGGAAGASGGGEGPLGARLPRFISSEYSIPERKEVYAAGGFIVATARILTHDFLRSIIPAENVCGVLVHDAHKVNEESAEAFVLSLYRRANKTGFIKAFSENPEALRRGFHNAEKTMRCLFVQRMFLWPRFHESVQDILDERPADVVEMVQPMTTAMRAIQQSILDTIRTCVEELRKVNRNVDLTDLKVEDALFRSFHDIVRRQLEPVWHLTGSKTRQLIEDLKVLRKLLISLHRLDCVEFHELMESLRQTEGPHSTWLMTKTADVLFNLVRKRVYRYYLGDAAEGEAEDLDEDKDVAEAGDDGGGESVHVMPVLEPNPKWKLLEEVLDEIEKEAKSLQRDEKTLEQLRRVLSCGAESHLNAEFERFLRQRSNRLFRAAVNASMKVAARTSAAAETAANAPDGPGPLQTTLTQIYGKADTDSATGAPRRRQKYIIRRVRAQGRAEEDVDGGARPDGTSPSTPGPQIKKEAVTVSAEGGQVPGSALGLQAPTQDEDRSRPPSSLSLLPPSSSEVILAALSPVPNSVRRFLDDLQPHFVVLYDPNIDCVRQVELFKAERPGWALRVYFLSYESSVEEQKYLYTVKQEQDAFESLIRERSTMIIYTNQEGRMEEEEPPTAEDERALLNKRGLGADRDSRMATAASAAASRLAKRQVVVDLRELRSSLSSILYKHGMELLPATLTIGDYILTPNICVERKTISDLISSFGSGRLFNQVEKMVRHYSTPCLLLEFDSNRPLSLASSADLDRQVSMNSIVTKTVILTQQFPQLRILWCRGPHETAKLFRELKAHEEEPSEEVATRLGLGEEDDDALLENKTSAATGGGGNEVNMAPLQFLRSLPGVSSKNIRRVFERVSTVRELFTLSREELNQMLGAANGKVLHDFIHADSALVIE